MFERPSHTRLLKRFADREDVGREHAIRDFWSHLAPAAVEELADLIEVEYAISFGLLRPNDEIGRLVAPFEIGNPLTWLWSEAALEDATSELNYRLAKRRPDLKKDFGAITTVRDLVEVWCGSAA